MEHHQIIINVKLADNNLFLYVNGKLDKDQLMELIKLLDGFVVRMV